MRKHSLLKPRLLITYLHALRLAFHAQRIRRQPIPEVISFLTQLRGLPSISNPNYAVSACHVATKHIGYLGQIDTCVIKALVLGTLLCDKHTVTLHIGFRPAENVGNNSTIDGHAWISIANIVYLAEDSVTPYMESRTFEMQRD